MRVNSIGLPVLETESDHCFSTKESLLNWFDTIAIRHYNSVVNFGRFPERNIYLNRTSTSEEKAFLSA